jgi:hypothetical protein
MPLRGLGYISKAQMAHDLVLAINYALSGERYISPRESLAPSKQEQRVA